MKGLLWHISHHDRVPPSRMTGRILSSTGSADLVFWLLDLGWVSSNLKAISPFSDGLYEGRGGELMDWVLRWIAFDPKIWSFSSEHLRRDMILLPSYVYCRLHSIKICCFALTWLLESLQFAALEWLGGRGIGLPVQESWRGWRWTIASRRYSSTIKSLLLQHQEHVKGDKTGAFGPKSAVFIFQKVLNTGM